MIKIKQITGADQQKTHEEAMRDQFQNQYRSSSTPQPDREEKKCSHVWTNEMGDWYCKKCMVLKDTPTPQDAQGEWEDEVADIIVDMVYAATDGQEKIKKIDLLELPPHDGWDRLKKVIDRHYSHLLSTQLERLGERVRKEVIGEDEPYISKTTPQLNETMNLSLKQVLNGKKVSKNILRVGQRQALDLLIQEEKKKV